jgi:hypothetical protein
MLNTTDAADNGCYRIVRTNFKLAQDLPVVYVSHWMNNRCPIVIEPGEALRQIWDGPAFKQMIDEHLGLGYVVDADVRRYMDSFRGRKDRWRHRSIAAAILTGLSVFAASNLYCYAFHDHTPLIVTLLQDLELTPPT